jgi:hydroxymethylglutaryl-CoA lyase
MSDTQKTLPLEIVEVGPRDGLQNEVQILSPAIRINFIKKLVEAGLKRIEVGSFVSPKWVPQMTRTGEVLKGLQKLKLDCRFSVLVPNLIGLEQALTYDTKEIAVFTAASDSFSQKNTNVSIHDSLEKIKPVVQKALTNNMWVRGYISCVLGCPYSGFVPPEAVLDVALKLADMGVHEISLGDTIGKGYPETTKRLLDVILKNIEPSKLAVHFHDTYGQALANILIARHYGVHIVDSSVAGLGGCPYAAGASGNVATEDVLYMLQENNTHSINMPKLIEAGRYISNILHITPRSKVARALLS